jgi:mannose-6-phosphate isomerase-like protein (cupin superfamily)
MHRLVDAGTYAVQHDAPTYIENLRVPHMSVGTYSIPSGACDPQGPHTEDEIYVVISGQGTLWGPTHTVRVSPGDVLFVPAGEPHRFEDVSEGFCVLVVFGPAEHTLSDPNRPEEQGSST